MAITAAPTATMAEAVVAATAAVAVVMAAAVVVMAAVVVVIAEAVEEAATVPVQEGMQGLRLHLACMALLAAEPLLQPPHPTQQHGQVDLLMTSKAWWRLYAPLVA